MTRRLNVQASGFEQEFASLVEARREADQDVADTVAAIVAEVRRRGDAALIDYVSGFVANGVGASFDPHVSTGIASIDYLDRMLAEPFLPFAFAPASAAVYQLGPFGTAARLLKRWDAAG